MDTFDSEEKKVQSEKEKEMTFWDKFKVIWLKFKFWQKQADQIERKEKELAWARARLGVFNDENWEGLKNWFYSLVFDYFNLAMQDGIPNEKYLEWKAKSNIILTIIDTIEETTAGQIEIDEKKLEMLKKKKE